MTWGAPLWRCWCGQHQSGTKRCAFKRRTARDLSVCQAKENVSRRQLRSTGCLPGLFAPRVSSRLPVQRCPKVHQD
ncbi:unnamed protein product [Caretta caretta]